MAYNPTLADMDAIEGSLATQQTAGAYQPIPATQQTAGAYQPTLEQIDILAGEQRAPQPEGSFFGNLMRGLPHGVEEFGRGAINVGRRTLPDLGGDPALSAVMASANPLAVSLMGPQLDIPGMGQVKNPFYPGSSIKPGTEPITREEAGIPASEGVGGAIGEYIGNALPTILLPQARLLEAPALISKAVAGAGPIVKNIANTLGIAAKNSLVGAGISPFYMPDTSLPESITTGAVFGGIAGPALKAVGLGAGKIAEGVRKLGRLGGTATPAQIERAIAQAPGGRLPLGEAIDSPALKQFQSAILSKTPFSGMAKEYKNLGEAVVEPVKNMFEGFQQNIKTNPADDIVNFIKNKYDVVKDISRKNYQSLHDLADSVGAKFHWKNYKQEANKAIKKIEDELIDNPEFSTVQTEEYSKMLNFLKQAADKPDTGQFKAGGLADAKLNDLLRGAFSKNDKNVKRILTPVKNALLDDYEASAKLSGNPELYSQWTKAKDFYRNSVVPLQEKNILDFTLGKKNPSQVISQFIKTGKSEEPEKLSQLLIQLPDELRQSLAHGFITKGKSLDDTKNLNNALAEYMRLGPRTQELLLKPHEQKVLKDSLDTSRRLGAQKNQMFIPKTGEMNAILNAIKLFGSGAAGAASVTGNIPAVLAMGGVAATPGLIKKALMSPSVRNLAKKAAAAEERALKKGKTDSTKTSKLLPALYAEIQKSRQNGG